MMDPDRLLPDVIVAGFMKCGTTTLQSWLVEQHEFTTNGVKEVNFFSKDQHFSRGLDWYHSQLGSPLVGLTVDASPQYLMPDFGEVVAHRIADFNPTVAVVVLYRDPIERAVSHFRHEVGRGREKTPIEEVASALTINSVYVRGSGYASCIKPFVERLGIDQLNFVESSELGAAGWSSILEQLGLAHRAPPGHAKNVSDGKPAYSQAMRLLFDHGLRRAPDWAPRGVRRAAKKILLREPVHNPPALMQIRASMPPESVDFLDREWSEFQRLVQ